MTITELKVELLHILHWTETDRNILKLIEMLIQYLEEKEKQNG